MKALQISPKIQNLYGLERQAIKFKFNKALSW